MELADLEELLRTEDTRRLNHLLARFKAQHDEEIRQIIEVSEAQHQEFSDSVKREFSDAVSRAHEEFPDAVKRSFRTQ